MQIVAPFLEGVATDWFATDIDNPKNASWSFINVIYAMHHRFVRTANNGISQYDKVEYSAAEGVEGFYYKLDLGEWAIASHGRVLVPQGGWWFQYVNILYIIS